MPVPSAFSDLSETSTSNSPQGSESVGTNANEYLQAAFAFIRMLYDGQSQPIAPVNFNGQQLNNAVAGVVPTDVAVVGQLSAPSGTRMVLQQAAAPTGWTVDASANLTDCAMRFNQTVGNGGTAGWSTFNSANTIAVSQTAITQAQMPAHTHTDSGHGHAVNDPTHNHGVGDPLHAHSVANVYTNQSFDYGLATGGGAPSSNNNVRPTNAAATGIFLSPSGTGVSINPGAANLTATGGGGGHSHNLVTPAIKYTDCIVALKS